MGKRNKNAVYSLHYFILFFDMDMSYTRVLHIKVAYRVPHKLRHTAAAMRAHNVLCDNYNSRDKPLQLSSCTFLRCT
jgi:hypothetical protein